MRFELVIDGRPRDFTVPLEANINCGGDFTLRLRHPETGETRRLLWLDADDMALHLPEITDYTFPKWPPLRLDEGGHLAVIKE